MATDSYYNSISIKNQNYVIGTGTAISSIRQIRNQFYDAAYRQEVSREGFYKAQYEAISEVEGLFGEVGGVQFQKSIEELWSSMQELAKSPDSLVVRSTVINAASDFLTRAKDIYNQLCEYQIDLNTKIKNSVNEINDLGNKIYDLNQKIVKIEMAGIENANDLRDMRNMYLDDLSKLIDIEYYEEPTGAVNVIAEGANFVTNMGCNEIGLNTDDAGFVTPYWKAYKEDVFADNEFYTITPKSDYGYLKGLMMARGDKQASMIDMPIEPKESDYTSTAEYNNALNAYLTATEEYNKTIDTSSIMSVMTQFDTLISGIARNIDDVLAPNTEIDIIVEDDYGNLVNRKMTILDEKNAPVGMDEKTTVGETLFSRVGVDRYEDVKVTVYRRDENGQIIRDIDGNALTEEIVVKKYVEENPENKSTLYTISELQVNPEVIHNYSKLPLSTLENNNEYGYNTVVIDLVEVWDKEFAKIAPGTMTNYNFQDYYTAMIEDMGNVGYTMKIMMEGQQTMVDSANDTRENYMGVSTDEELSNLMKSQNAYNASSRYFNVINSMLETLILGLG
jgi:flagellar hook-associated protein 1 FlgK